jgi:hypothetical protein
MTVGFSLAKAAATCAAVAMLTFAGCSSQKAQTSPQQAAGKYAEMTFDLDKCRPIEANLYQCPAIDKPLCTAEFARTDVECVRLGPRGNVYMSQTGMF